MDFIINRRLETVDKEKDKKCFTSLLWETEDVYITQGTRGFSLCGGDGDTRTSLRFLRSPAFAWLNLRQSAGLHLKIFQRLRTALIEFWFKCNGNPQIKLFPRGGLLWLLSIALIKGNCLTLSPEINWSFKFMKALTKLILFWSQDLNVIGPSMHLKICSTTVCVSQLIDVLWSCCSQRYCCKSCSYIEWSGCVVLCSFCIVDMIVLVVFTKMLLFSLCH